VTPRLPKAEPVDADCVWLPSIVIEAGTCTTVTLSVLLLAAVPELVWTGSPPPQTKAVFDTVTGELAGTLTVTSIVQPLPIAIAVVDVQETTLELPLHVHAFPVDTYEASV
jgi:hypothetical protein